MENVIEVKDLTFGYDEKIVLDKVNFNIEKGDYVGLIGPNGCGKSTLIKLLTKSLKIDSGEIKLLGEDINNLKDWSKIGYISQKSNAFNTSFPATVEEVVGANLFSKVGMFGFLKREHKEKIHHALELVGMQDYKKSLIGNLSGGQQQRVFISRVLVSEPEIMFLDEPTVGVDLKAENKIYCLLAKLNKELGITIVLVSHDVSAVNTHANKLLCIGNEGFFVHNPKHKFTKELLKNIYGHDVHIHMHKHMCAMCDKIGNQQEGDNKDGFFTI